MTYFTSVPEIAQQSVANIKTQKNHFQLPKSYTDLFSHQPASKLIYLNTGFIKTIEPTNDGMDHVVCHALFNPHRSEQVDHIYSLPDYLIPFSQNEQQYFVFDFLANSINPKIRYLDLEVDQWLDIAPNFDIFINQLTQAPFSFLPSESFTTLKSNHYFLLADDQTLPALFERFESDTDKNWYFQWIYYFAKSHNQNQILQSFQAFRTQLLYFHRYLPADLPTKLGTLFKSNPVTNGLYQQLESEL